MKKTTLSFGAMGGVLVALPAFAADDGLPQFNTALFPEQLFWLAVAFSVLYLLMKFLALPGVERVQDKRKDVIETEISAAKAANENAKEMGHQADKALADARAKANATISDIKAQTSKVAAEQQATQSKQLNQKLRDAEANIAATRDAALKEIEGSADDLASAIVENVSGLKVKA